MAEQNYYGLTGGVQRSHIKPVLPITFVATAEDFETVALTWDETDAVCQFLDIQFSEGTAGEGTVATTLGSNEVEGILTNFTDFTEGQVIDIAGEGTFYIIEIIDDTHLQIDGVAAATDDTLDWSVSGAWQELVALPVEALEAYDHEDLTAETIYFYRMRGKHRMWWSHYDTHCAVTTPEE